MTDNPYPHRLNPEIWQRFDESSEAFHIRVTTDEQLAEWERLALAQKSSQLIGYEWAEKTRPLLNAVIRLVAACRAYRRRSAALARELEAAQKEITRLQGVCAERYDALILLGCDAAAALAAPEGEKNP